MSSSAVRVRFAPSPTGYLHVGGARTALFNWLYARSVGGQFVLRVEDTDEKRNTPEAKQAIYDGLEWLGLDWDEGPLKGGEAGPYFQSERQGIYEKYFKILQDKGLIYDDKGAGRFKSPLKELVVEDAVCGNISFDLSKDPDMTLRRPDGSFIFHFVNVVDDIEMGITHVIRGEDHLSNTPKHLQIFAALEATPPKYAHIPLILNADGSKMSKRDKGAAVKFYQDAGYAPEAVVNYLCLLGWSPKEDREILPIAQIIELFKLEGINRRNAHFDLDKCFWINGQYVQSMSLERFRELAVPFMTNAGISFEPGDYLDAVLTIVKEKVKLFADIPDWVGYFFTEDFAYEADAVRKRLAPEGALDRLAKLAEAFGAVSGPEWKADHLQKVLEDTAAALGIKTGELIHPSRVAVSGRGVGPSLYHMLEVMGKERVISRFAKAKSAV
jgi:glutamyl-tRNA synthetase